MKASEIAAELLKTPDAEVLLKYGADWLEVFGVQPTGHHRNAVTLVVTADIGVPGVIVVPPEE